MSAPIRSPNLFFPLTVAISVLFVVTILALVATAFGDPRAPVSQWLDRSGGWLLAGEVAGILLAGFLALALDRRQNRVVADENLRSPSNSERPHEHSDGN